jgi:hypothetical protein
MTMMLATDPVIVRLPASHAPSHTVVASFPDGHAWLGLGDNPEARTPWIGHEPVSVGRNSGKTL